MLLWWRELANQKACCNVLHKLKRETQTPGLIQVASELLAKAWSRSENVNWLSILVLTSRLVDIQY